MKKTKYTEQQIAFALKQAETGTRVAEVCRKMGISECSGQQKPDKVLDSFSAFAGGKPLLYACGLTQL